MNLKLGPVICLPHDCGQVTNLLWGLIPHMCNEIIIVLFSYGCYEFCFVFERERLMSCIFSEGKVQSGYQKHLGSLCPQKKYKGEKLFT